MALIAKKSRQDCERRLVIFNHEEAVRFAPETPRL
jgi:hypothetical protein